MGRGRNMAADEHDSAPPDESVSDPPDATSNQPMAVGGEMGTV
jgi:hypothetical protein